MSSLALAMVLALAIPPTTVPARTPPPETQKTPTETTDVVSVTVPDTLQQALDLLREPGFHPELLKLFDLEDPARDASAPLTPAPAGLGKTVGIVIVVFIVVAVTVAVLFATGTS